MERFALSELQARAILDMRLQKLTGLEIDKVKQEYAELMKVIDYLKEILASKELRMKIIRDELLEIKEKYGDKRRSTIEFSADDFKIEDTIPDETVVVTISHLGYIKRTALSEYRIQNRGGRGSKGSSSREEDFIEYIFVATNHNYMLFFTELGKVFWMRVFEIPEGTKVSKGRAIQNMINIEREDKLKAFINIKDLTDKEYIENNYIVLVSKKGIIKKTTVEAYSRPRQNGINAITIREGDELLEARLTNGSSEIMMALRSGRAIRFPEDKVRPMGRNASGVRGIYMEEEDELIGMITLADANSNVLVVSENGYGKRSSIDDYRVTNRGGKGVKTINITEKTGKLISIKDVTDEDDLIIVNRSGILIRIAVADLRVMGRATQGVRLIKLQEDDSIAAVTKVRRIIEEQDEMVADDEPTSILDEEISED
jgi:DNA gyrase subunit A